MNPVVNRNNSACCRHDWLAVLLSAFVVLVSVFGASAQTLNTLQGLVRDSVSHEPVSFAVVKVIGTPRGVLADDKGRFTINTYRSIDTVEVSSMGYETKKLYVKPGNKKIRVDLVSTGVQLGEVVVKPKKEKYSKKNNPAVEFVRRIRNARDLNNPRKNHDFYNYDKYERVTIALNNISPESNKNLILKQFEFLRDNIDTSEVSGRPILAISTREKMSHYNYSRDKDSEKETVTGLRQEGLDDFLDEDNS